MISPSILSALDPSGAPLDSSQIALITAIATLAGGVTAGLADTNPQAGATAAENEALNNSTKHWVTALLCFLCAAGVRTGSDNPFEASKSPFTDDPSLGVTDPEDIPREIEPYMRPINKQ